MYIIVVHLLFFQKEMSVDPTFKRGTALSEAQIRSIRAKTQMLLHAAFQHGEHDAFKEHMEKNPVRHNFTGDLAHGIRLVTDNIRQITEVAPTLTILLQYSANWNCDDLFRRGTKTPCHVICLAAGDHHELLNLMIKEIGRAVVDVEDNCASTALMYAVQNANIKCVKTLIANGADINFLKITKSSRRFDFLDTEMITQMVSPLIDSVNLLHPKSHHSSDVMMDIVDVLLESGVDVNTPCDHERTPVMYAGVVGNTNCVQKLIQKGARLNTADAFGRTIWSLAAFSGNVDMLKCLLEDNGIDKNSIDAQECSVLYWAVIGGKCNIEAIRYLLHLGATTTTYIPQECMKPCTACGTNLAFHLVNEEELYTDPYMLAICDDHPEALKLLEEYGCQLYKSLEVLSYAVGLNSEKVVDYLLRNHKYPLHSEYSENGDHQTLLKVACQKSSVKVIKLLLEHGADPNTKRDINMCPGALNVAISNRHVEIIALFIRSGVNVNAKCVLPYVGMMLPFETAVLRNHIYAAKMLLVAGCSRGKYFLDSDDQIMADINPELRNFMEEWELHKNNVLPLQQKCRMMILNHLSPQADKKITELPLPPQLINYLSIPELDNILETFNSDPQRDTYENIPDN